MKPLILSDDEFDKLPDANESSNILSDEDFDKLPDAPDQEITGLESAIRGAAQEASFGLADELAGLAETGLETAKGNVPLSASELLKSYQRLRDESRQAYKAAEEANPASYLGGQIVGGIAPALATGGAGIAGKLAAGAATKAGIGQLIKEGAKAGVKYGAAQGFGKSEAEIAEGELGQLAKDIALEGAIGGVAGGVMPLAAPALKGAAKEAGKAPKAVGNLIKKLPGFEKAADSYEWGKLGKGLTIEDIDPEMRKLGQTILKDISDAKGSVNIKKAKEVFDQAGIVIDTEQTLQQVISDIEDIAQIDFLKASKANQVLPLLQQLAGKDLKAQKLVDQLEKRMVKQAVQSSTKAEQAVIKGEKKLFDQALKSGDEIDSITNLNRSFEDIAEIPTDTSKGTIGGIKANLKRTAIDPETGEEVAENVSKMITSDVTPFQPTAPTLTVDPITGRTIAVSKDLGTGKVDAIVGEILNNPAFTPNQVPLNTIDKIISTINNYTKIAKTQGNSEDATIKRLQGWAGELRRLQNEAMDQSGLGTDVIKSRKAYSNIKEAEGLLGIDKKYSAVKSIDQAQKATQLAEQFGYESGFKGREERRLVEDLLQGNIQPQTLKEAELLRKVNAIVGTTGDKAASDTISRSSLFQQIVTEVPNMAGKGRASIDQSMRKIGTAISNATPVEIQNMATLLKNSSNKAAQTFAPMVEQAIGQDGKVRKAALFALYQQPAFREMVKQISGAEGATQKALEEYTPPINPEPPQGTTSFNLPTEAEEEEDQKKNQDPLNNLYSTFERQVGTSGRAIAEHLAEVESNFGKAQGVEEIGMTKGVFHITKDAALAVASPELKRTIQNMSESQYAQYVANNPRIDAELSGRYSNSLLKNLEANGVVLENLSDNEIASVVGNLYNYPNQPKLKEALKTYSERKNIASPIELNRLKQNVVNRMDVIKAGGKVSDGLVKRRNKEKKLFLKTPTAQNSNQASTQDVSGLLEKFAGIAGKGLRSVSNAIIPEAAAAADMPLANNINLNNVFNAAKAERDLLKATQGERILNPSLEVLERNTDKLDNEDTETSGILSKTLAKQGFSKNDIDRIVKNSRNSFSTNGVELAQTLINSGYTPVQAAAIAGNVAVETMDFRKKQEIQPTVKDSLGGYGYAQWTGARAKEFFDFAKNNNLDPSTDEANLAFLLNDLKNKNIWGAGNLNKFNKLTNNNDIEKATDLVRSRYLRPGVPHAEEREKAAKEILEELKKLK